MFHESKAHVCHRFKGQREHLPHERRELRVLAVVLGGFALGSKQDAAPYPWGTLGTWMNLWDFCD